MRLLWNTRLIADPAVHASVLLYSVVHMRLRQAKLLPENLLHKLRGHALACIGNALDSHERCTGDALLVAVLVAAISARLCGWHDDHAIHMQGLAELQKARIVPIDKTLEGVLWCTLSAANMIDL
jgi:hypothetical protein